MADTNNMNQNNSNETMDRKPGESMKQNEQGTMSSDRNEQGRDKSAIGGQSSTSQGSTSQNTTGQDSAQTGEQGRARSELDQNQTKSEPTSR